MIDKRVVDAYQSIRPDEGLSGRIWDRLMEQDDAAAPEKEVIRKTVGRPVRIIRTVLIAAVIAGLMGITAFAAGVLGRETLEVPAPRATPQKIVIGEDGLGRFEDNGDEGGVFSITQPQDLPDDLDPAIQAKIENSKAAWAEWEAWRETHRAEQQGGQAGMPFPGYDGWYGAETQEQAEKLEEIAARYGLKLRGDRETLYGSGKDYYAIIGKPDWASEEQYAQMLQTALPGETTEDMLAALSARFCRGDLFLTPPPFIDHLYWYDEGTFAVDYLWKNQEGTLAYCYAFNSMYGTLSSGEELFSEVEDLSAYQARPYLTADGTEITILESEHLNAWGWHDPSFLFVYLDDSFFVVEVHCDTGLDPGDLEQIADSIRYSAINR